MKKQRKNIGIRKILATGATILYLAGHSLVAQPLSGSFDAISTDRELTEDTKLSLDLNRNVNIFARNRTAFNYDRTNTPFTLLDLSYNWSNGLGILEETQFPDNQNPDPRFGLQYFKGIRNFSLYAEATAGDSSRLNGEAVLNGRYSRPLASNLNAIAQIETVTDFDKTGITFATQRYKVGLGLNKHIESGLEIDFTEIPSNGSINKSHTLGGYLTYKF